MPLITANEVALLKTEIEYFESPLEYPIDISVDDPLYIMVRYEQPTWYEYPNYTSGSTTQLTINEELYLKRFMNMAVAEKLIEKGGFFKID